MDRSLKTSWVERLLLGRLPDIDDSRHGAIHFGFGIWVGLRIYQAHVECRLATFAGDLQHVVH